MKIVQLIQVIEIARVKSITQAAKNMYMAQSNLSTSIKELESELNQNIFFRSEKGMQLTPFGEEFLTQAKIIVKQFDYIRSMADIQNDWSTHFSISSYYFLFASYLFIELFQENKDKDITFNYEEASRSRVIHSVYNRTSELGIISIPTTTKREWLNYLDSHDMEYQKITEVTPVAMVGAGSPLFRRDDTANISVEELQNLPLVYYDQGDKLFKGDNSDYAPEIFKPEKIVKVSDRATLIDFLRKTPCYHIAAANDNAYKRYLYHADIKNFYITDCPFKYEIGWVKGKNNYLSPLAKQFLVRAQKVLVLEKNNTEK